MYILGYPLGLIMRLLYNLLHSYGWSLILFTLLIKLVMVPLSIKQQKSSAKIAAIQPQMQEIQKMYAKNQQKMNEEMQKLIKLVMVPLSIKQQKSSAKIAAIQPQMQEIQKMYAKNQQKMNEEMQKLYEREKYNPAGGCLPMLITFLVLFGLIDVIYNPMRHILGMSNEVIAQATEILKGLGIAFSQYSPQTAIISSVQANPEAYSAMGADFINAVQSFNLNFLGINLGETPSFGMNVLMLIPILSGVTAFAVSWISMKINPAAMEGPGAGTMKVMMFVSPLMSLYIAFQVPAGVGMYWILSNLFMMGQTLILNKFYNPREMAEKAKREAEERREKERLERIEAKKKARSGDAQAQALILNKFYNPREMAEKAKREAEERREKERLERIEAKKKARSGDAQAQARAKSQKEINRQKLAAARKADAEKYGDVYTDVTDDDLE